MSRGRAMVVEDRHQFAEAVAGVLRTLGYSVAQADICDTAIGAWARWGDAGPPSLVVTDIYLAGPDDLDGLDVLRMVAEHRDGVPVVVMSGQERDPSLGDLVRLRGGAYLDKPFTRDALRLAISEAGRLARSRMPQPLDTITTTIRRLSAVGGRPVADI